MCLVQVGSERQDQAQREGDVRDQAKQWLSAGRDWLSGASKKVAQAVKETQAQINNKLEELDSRHSQGTVCTHICDTDMCLQLGLIMCTCCESFRSHPTT